MSMMVSFVLFFFPRGVLDEILNLIESVSEGFPSYFFTSEIKIDLTLKKSNFLFLLCFKIAIVKFIPMSQQ